MQRCPVGVVEELLVVTLDSKPGEVFDYAPIITTPLLPARFPPLDKSGCDGGVVEHP